MTEFAADGFTGGAGVADDAAMPSPVDDETASEALMLRYAGGDIAAFETLYRRHKDGLWRYFLRQGCDAATAAELFQDVWAKLVRARGRYRAEARFNTWLYTLAQHRLIDHWRSHRALDGIDEHALDAAAPEHQAPAVRAGQAEQAERLRRAIGALPAEQRTAFLLQVEGGLTLAEIAAQQQVGRETVKSRLRYALAKLRQELADVWP